MPSPETPDLTVARDEEEWRQCAVALLYALTNGSIGKIERWEPHFKMLVQRYADLQAEGKIKKKYAPENPQDELLAREELLRGYNAILNYQDFLERQKKELDKRKEVENGTSR